jgi:hypothetical protein
MHPDIIGTLVPTCFICKGDGTSQSPARKARGQQTHMDAGVRIVIA